MIVLILGGPVLAGLIGVILSAFGYFPALGMAEPNLNAFRDVLATPGFYRAICVSMFSGFGATLLALAGALLIASRIRSTQIRRWLGPALAIPHAAAAFGFAFLIAPSGWIVRLFSPWATGFERPPDWLILQDPMGVSLMLGLAVKEIPFLLLVVLAALPQVNAPGRLRVAISLGYSPIAAWWLAVAPSVYRQIRLPVLLVLAWSLSVVDVALILGPSTPPTLAVMVLKWANAPDLSLRLQAAAAGVVLLVLVLIAAIGWRLAELLAARLYRRRVVTGQRRLHLPLRSFASVVGAIEAFALLGGFTVVLLWSVAGQWLFPMSLPATWTLRTWQRQLFGLESSLLPTIGLASLSVLIALVLTLWLLESKRALPSWLLYLPLVAPQVVFLPGIQIAMLQLGLPVGSMAVLLGHLVFVLPYVILTLTGAYHTVDPRFMRVGAALGAGPLRSFFVLRLPLLLSPLLASAAIGFAVSVGQYLPTLLLGGGRVPTLTTEAVALAAGGDRRAIGVTASLQFLATIVPFLLASIVPFIVWRRRRGMADG